MQDKTINGALKALRKQGGAEGKLAEVLLDMRGVDWSCVVQDNPLKRGQCRRFVLNSLKDGPKTTAQIAAELVLTDPQIGRRGASNRVYQALLRAVDKGLVQREGRLWRRFLNK